MSALFLRSDINPQHMQRIPFWLVGLVLVMSSLSASKILAQSSVDPWDTSWLPTDDAGKQAIIAAVDDILVDTGMAGQGSTVVGCALDYGVNPAFALAMFRKEASFAVINSRAYRNKNPGNIIATGECRGLPTDSRCSGIYGEIGTDGRFGVYGSMADGIKAYFWLLNREYGELSLEDIIKRYCPPHECDVDLYIADIQGWTAEYQTLIVSHKPPVPPPVQPPSSVTRSAPFIAPTYGYLGLGYRKPYTDGTVLHSGIDIWSVKQEGIVWPDPDEEHGFPVYAVYEGELGLTGSGVEICHPELTDWPDLPEAKVCTYYGHLKDLPSRFAALSGGCSDMVHVRQGELLGYADYDGKGCKCVHLHFSIVKQADNDCWMDERIITNTLDPTQYLGSDLYDSGRDPDWFTDFPDPWDEAVFLGPPILPQGGVAGKSFSAEVKLLRNVGHTVWSANDHYVLARLSEESSEVLETFPLMSGAVLPGETAIFTVEIVPQKPPEGSIIAFTNTHWQLRHWDQLFGPVFVMPVSAVEKPLCSHCCPCIGALLVFFLMVTARVFKT